MESDDMLRMTLLRTRCVYFRLNVYIPYNLFNKYLGSEILWCFLLMS